MTERDVLSFPSPDDASRDDASRDDASRDGAKIAARVAVLYAATPSPAADQADRCARAVLAQAMHQPSRTALGVSRVRWWWGAAAAALLVVGVMRLSNTDGDGGERALAPSASVLQGSITELGSDEVRFDLHLPSNARAVAIVGDFNGWNQSATPMARTDGTWSAKVPLAPGRHVYAFVVDGKKWVVDPLAPRVPDDGYGPANAVVIDALPKE